MKAKVNTAIFLALMITITAAFIVMPKRAYSENENRFLARLPEFSLSGLLDGEVTKGFEDYVTDGMPLRDRWIALKSQLDLLAGRGDTGGVYVTRDGSLIEMFTSVDQGRFRKNLDYIRQAKKNLDISGSFRVMLVPTASCILRDKIGVYTPETDQAALLDEASDLLSADCLTALSGHSDEYIYYRNDHHWTSLGAYYCYQALMGEEALPLSDFGCRLLSDRFLGTTFSKAGIYYEKDRMDAYVYGSPTVEYNMSGEIHEGIYETEYLDKKDKYSVYLNGNQALSVIKTGSEGGKLLLVKDSYANTFVQFLLPHYSEIHVVDLRSFGMSLSQYARQAGIEDVLVLYNLKGFSQETSLFRIAG